MAHALSCSTENPDPTKSAIDRPILITGCARSRTSMVAGTIKACGVWGGDMFGSAPGNPTGFFENKDLRERLVKPVLQTMGCDPLGVYPLPPYPDPEKWGPHIRNETEAFLEAQGYQGEPWFYKGAKMAYLWPAWHEAFPNAKWVIVRREKEEIINSCLRTHFMVQHSDKKEFWEKWVDETVSRLEDMKEVVDYVEVWPPDGMREMVDALGLEWTEEAETFNSEPYKRAETLVEISTDNPIPNEAIVANVKRNVERDLPWVGPEKSQNEPLVIVGGGPSLKRKIPQLKKQKGKILAINGAHDFLVDNGIKPWGMMMLDPRPDMGMFASEPCKGVKYFIASQCDPDVFDRLENYDVRVWHAWVGAGEEEFLRAYHRRDWYLIGGGSTCGLRAFHMAMLLGFKKIHCYGMDSCLEDEEHHAYEQDIRKSGLERVVRVHAEGTEFWATAWMFAQAQDFNKLLSYHGDKFSVTFHGGGLLAHIAAKHPNRK